MPKAELKEKVGVKSTFAVEIEPERVEKQIRSTLGQVKARAEIPGFRKGKAPETMVMQHYGAHIREEAVKALLPDVLAEIFKEKAIEPVGNPQITDFKFEKTGPMTFTVMVEELPKIDISGFEGITVEKEKYGISEQDIDEYIEEIRRSRATRQEVDRSSQKDDILIVNMQRSDEAGVPLLDKRLENQIIPLSGKGGPSPDFEEQLVGLKKGDRKLVGFTYSDSASFAELRGTRDNFMVDVVNVYEESIPELTEEFVKSLGDYKDITDFREHIRKLLESQSEMVSERNLRSKLMDAFIEEHPFDVPETMVTRIMDSKLEELRQKEGEGYIHSEMRKDAVRVVKTHLILETIKNQKGTEPSKEEIDNRLTELAMMNKTTTKELRRELIKEGSMDSLKADIAREKAYQWIQEIAQITEKNVEPQNG